MLRLARMIGDLLMLMMFRYRAYGSVYKGIQKGSGNVFAIKVITALGNTSQMEELKKEIEILKKCTNKYIVSYYGSLSTDDAFWVPPQPLIHCADEEEKEAHPTSDRDGLLLPRFRSRHDRDVQQTLGRESDQGEALGSHAVEGDL